MKQTIGEFLATLRKAKGLTQEDVAEKLNISNRTLSSWENDRTYPDVLSLPALAELYDVTIEEIIKGEKNSAKIITEAETVVMSDKAAKSISKRKFSKFSNDHLLFTSFGMLGAVLAIIGFAFLAFTPIDAWVGILFSIFGFISAPIFTILLIFYEKNLLASEGIVTEEDKNENNISLVAKVRQRTSLSLILFSIPYLVLTVADAFYFILTGGRSDAFIFDGEVITIDFTVLLVTFLLLSATMGIAFLVFGTVRANLNIRNNGNETHKSNRKSNSKLFEKLSIVSGSVLTGLLILATVISCVPIYNGYYVCDIHDTFEEYRDYRSEFMTYPIKNLYYQKNNGIDNDIDASVLLLPTAINLYLPDDFDPNNDGIVPLGNNFFYFNDNTVQYKCNDCYYFVSYASIVQCFHDKYKKDFDWLLINGDHIFSEKTAEQLYYSYYETFFGKYDDDTGYGQYGVHYIRLDKLPFVIFFGCFVAVSGITLVIFLTKRKKYIFKL